VPFEISRDFPSASHFMTAALFVLTDNAKFTYPNTSYGRPGLASVSQGRTNTDQLQPRVHRRKCKNAAPENRRVYTWLLAKVIGVLRYQCRLLKTEALLGRNEQQLLLTDPGECAAAVPRSRAESLRARVRATTLAELCRAPQRLRRPAAEGLRSPARN
jgi:hypothetical protein